MATDVTKVHVPNPPKVKGVIHWAPLGTEIPTDATTDLPAAYKPLGGVSDSGVTKTQGRDVQKIKDYGGDVIATPQSDYSNTFKVTFVESSNLEVLKVVFGAGNVTATANGFIVDENSDPLPKSVFIVDHLLGAEGVTRQIAAIAQPTSIGDTVYLHNDIVKYEVTFEAFPFVSGGKKFNVRSITDLGVSAGS